ncbi:hypothetical protein HMPREF1988_00709, partial [Porphyromonas gingivalis F0185]
HLLILQRSHVVGPPLFFLGRLLFVSMLYGDSNRYCRYDCPIKGGAFT